MAFQLENNASIKSSSGGGIPPCALGDLLFRGLVSLPIRTCRGLISRGLISRLIFNALNFFPFMIVPLSSAFIGGHLWVQAKWTGRVDRCQVKIEAAFHNLNGGQLWI